MIKTVKPSERIKFFFPGNWDTANDRKDLARKIDAILDHLDREFESQFEIGVNTSSNEPPFTQEALDRFYEYGAGRSAN